MKIILLRTWETNIGNGFIDKGAKECVRRAQPDAEIVETSGLVNKAVSQSGPGFFSRYIGERLGRIGDHLFQYGTEYYQQDSRKDNTVHLSRLLDADLAVFPGCILDVHMDWYFDTLKRLSNRDIPILLLGAGGLSYDKRTVRNTRRNISKLKTAGFVSRDEKSYKRYSDLFDYAYNGIDCGFYISDWYDPPKANQNFIVATFDKQKCPSFESNKKVIQAHHGSLMTPFSGYLTNMLYITIQRYRRKQFGFFENENTFISDQLRDYLFLYKNSKEVHSDRVHACVPALAYGNDAKFYHDTVRGGLFDKVLEKDISLEEVSIDRNKLKKEKESQSSFVREQIMK